MSPGKKPRKKPSRAKPSRLTEAVQKAIVQSVSCGASIPVAAGACGIPRATVEEWMRRGEGLDDRPPAPHYAAFAKAVREAQAVSEDHAIKVVRNAMNKTWTAAAWFLERTNPERWGLKNRHELSGPNNGPIQQDVKVEDKRTPADARAIMRELFGSVGPQDDAATTGSHTDGDGTPAEGPASP
jgi:hypothetical protein